MILVLIVLLSGSVLKGNPESSDAADRWEINMSSIRHTDAAGVEINRDTLILPLIATVVFALYILIIIFSYKNRIRQIRMATANYLIILLLFGLIVFIAQQKITGFNFMNSVSGSLVGLLMFLLLLYLNFRAISLIKKDEALVRSADRIR